MYKSTHRHTPTHQHTQVTYRIWEDAANISTRKPATRSQLPHPQPPAPQPLGPRQLQVDYEAKGALGTQSHLARGMPA